VEMIFEELFENFQGHECQPFRSCESEKLSPFLT
jgi:hypothetical protein